jgi:hypothetical protein
VRSLGLPDDVASDVKRVLAETEDGGRRELALLARTWAPAYRGEPIPERLVISGHGNGRAFLEWDDEEIADVRFRDLALAMPRAAAEVRSIHLAACQHGYDTRMETLREAFPNVSSMWGYAGFSPTASVAARHEAAWERASRGEEARASEMLDARASVRGSRRAENVAVWTREGGWVGPSQRELGVVMRDLHAGRDAYRAFFDGDRPLPDPMRGALAERYQQLQEVAAHGDFRDQSPAFREAIEREIDVTLRLRYFEHTVVEAFDRHYRAAIEAGYGALDLEIPSLAGMTRPEVRDEIARFRSIFEGSATRPRAARHLLDLLERGLWQLSPEVIPTTWI